MSCRMCMFGQTGKWRRVHVAYLCTAGAVCAESKQFGLVVGDQGSGPGTHAWHVSLVDPPGPQSPSLRAPRHKSIVFSLTTAGKRSDEVTEMSGVWLMLSSDILKKGMFFSVVGLTYLKPPCYMHKQAECLFFIMWLLSSQPDGGELKKASGRKGMKRWFKSGQMVGAYQSVSVGYITNRQCAFKLDAVAFSRGWNRTMDKSLSIQVVFHFRFLFCYCKLS